MAKSSFSNQIVGNVGLYYVCYRLSCLGWNAMPTARNARGIDLLIYSPDAKTSHTIQIKALSKKNAVPIGTNLECLLGDYLIVCCGALDEKPICYILGISEARELIKASSKPGCKDYWLEYKDYMKEEFRENWGRISMSIPNIATNSPTN